MLKQAKGSCHSKVLISAKPYLFHQKLTDLSNNDFR